MSSVMESEGFEENYRAVIEWGRPLMNRSAKDGVGRAGTMGAKAFSSPIVPRCLLAARYGRSCVTPGDLIGFLVLN